jgi:hypothetical protein
MPRAQHRRAPSRLHSVFAFLAGISETACCGRRSGSQPPFDARFGHERSPLPTAFSNRIYGVSIKATMSALGHSLLMRLVPASHDVRSTPKADIRFQRNNLQRWANLRLMRCSNRCRPTRVGTDEFSPLAAVFELSLIWLATALARRRSIDVQ